MARPTVWVRGANRNPRNVKKPSVMDKIPLVGMRTSSLAAKVRGACVASPEIPASSEVRRVDSISVREHHGAEDDHTPRNPPFRTALRTRLRQARAGPIAWISLFPYPARIVTRVAVMDMLSGGNLGALVVDGHKPHQIATRPPALTGTGATPGRDEGGPCCPGAVGRHGLFCREIGGGNTTRSDARVALRTTT